MIFGLLAILFPTFLIIIPYYLLKSSRPQLKEWSDMAFSPKTKLLFSVGIFSTVLSQIAFAFYINNSQDLKIGILVFILGCLSFFFVGVFYRISHEKIHDIFMALYVSLTLLSTFLMAIDFRNLNSTFSIINLFTGIIGIGGILYFRKKNPNNNIKVEVFHTSISFIWITLAVFVR